MEGAFGEPPEESRGADLGKRTALQGRLGSVGGFGVLAPERLVVAGGADLVAADNKASRKPRGGQENEPEGLETLLHWAQGISSASDVQPFLARRKGGFTLRRAAIYRWDRAGA